MWTTSRYAPEDIRLLAKNLSEIFSNPYVSRGKKTINEITELARRAGDSRVFIIKGAEDEAGNRSIIEIIEINELGEWKWLEDKVEVRGDEK